MQKRRQLESEEQLKIVFAWQSNAHNWRNHIKWKFINHNQFFLLLWFHFAKSVDLNTIAEKKTFNAATTSMWLNTNSIFKTKLKLTLSSCRKHRIQSIFQIRCVQSCGDFFLSQLIFGLCLISRTKNTIFFKNNNREKKPLHSLTLVFLFQIYEFVFVA